MVALAMILVVALLPFADHQASVLGGHVWAPPVPLPTVEPSGLTYCNNVQSKDQRRIELAAAEMRRTGEGVQLLAMLVRHEVCVGTDDLSLNSGYTYIRAGPIGAQVQRIVLDTDTVRYLAADELAAILVHEATHASRFFRGTSCNRRNSCEILPNGVAVEEEVAAHQAEVRFWTEIHGPNGTQSGSSWTGTAGARYLNELVEVASEGPDAFRSYVVKIRSDPREGEGIDDDL
jgi:hypothetical protein